MLRKNDMKRDAPKNNRTNNMRTGAPATKTQTK
jgi:hypothetical protein